jgi:hypothetical protein
MSPDDLYDLPEMKELVDVIMGETGNFRRRRAGC